MKIHLDTDLGGDPDDACALGMLLAWPEIELVGVTTNLDVGGERAGCVRRILELAGRTEVPVVAGASSSLTTGVAYPSTAADARYWQPPVEPCPAPPGQALEAIQASLAAGATLVTIGALTNVALLEVMDRGALAGATVVTMGGWADPPGPGYPAWGPARDWNVQCDVTAAEIVSDAVAELTLVPIPVTVKVQLRAAHLPRLEAAGPIGRLLAQQSRCYGVDRDVSELAAGHAGLAPDLVNFHHDPLACAVAAGWPGVELATMSLVTEREGDVLTWRRAPEGRRVQVAVDVDAPAFDELWLGAIERLPRR